MSQETSDSLVHNGQSAIAVHGDGSPISVTIVLDILGTFFIGVLAMMLLVALQQERARTHALIETLLLERKP